MDPKRLVVLASGAGSRLRAKASPKPLVRVAGLTLIERAMAAAREGGFEHVVVVTGHRADAVDRHVLAVSRRRGIPVTIVRNERWREGNGLSVLAAREAVGDEPFALVMADHVFAPSILSRLRRTSAAPGEVVVMVDRSLGRAGAVDSTEATKVRLLDGRVRAIGKDLDAYDAFDIGAFVCTAALFEAVEAAAAAGDTSLSAAVQVLADAGAARAVGIAEDEWWFDVDTPRDHRRCARHLLGSTGKPLDGPVAARVNRVVSQRILTPALLALAPWITPNQVTVLAFAVALAAAAALAAGAPVAAAAALAAASILDGSDGEVARLTYRSSRFGAFLDAALDRAADGAVITGATIHLATGPVGEAAAIAVGGAALTGHVLVSYTTARAAVDLGHRYRGALVGGGHGRDVRLAVVTLGALAGAVEPLGLAAALAAVALLGGWIVVVRLRESWWVAGPGRPFVGVRAVALDFDGTVADSMGFLTGLAVRLLVDEVGMEPAQALPRYLATTGTDFRSQLAEIAPGHPRREEVARRFERHQEGGMRGCELFGDVRPALRELARAGVPVLICSSTRAHVVREVCARHGITALVAAIDGWAPGRGKTHQLAAWFRRVGVAPGAALFVGDSARDALVARAVGARFVGIARPGRPDLLAGSGAPVVGSLVELARAVRRACRSPVALGPAEGDRPPDEPPVVGDEPLGLADDAGAA